MSKMSSPSIHNSQSSRPVRPAVGIVFLLLTVLPAAPAAADGQPDGEQTLRLIRSWVAGRYDNSAQAERDLATAALPDDKKHRLMHQLFVPVPVEIPAIPGYLVFQQSSVDGSEVPEAIVRVGLLQFLIGEHGTVHQRELNFKDMAGFKNAHRDPERLRTLTLDQVRFDPGCDFLLRLAPSRTEIAGPIQPGACRFFSKGLNKELIADDAVTITPDEYWFLGRFVDETGAVMWGNASDEPVRMVRLP
jgi:hypothetical protein